MPSAKFNAERVLRHAAAEHHPIAQIVAVPSAHTGRAKLSRRLAPEGGQDWLEYCRAAYRGEPGSLLGAVLLDVGEAAESLERAVWRLEHTQLGRGQIEARELLQKVRCSLAGTLGTLVEINGLMQNADAPRALESLFGAEDRLTDEPESMKNMPRYAEFLVELLRATKPA